MVLLFNIYSHSEFMKTHHELKDKSSIKLQSKSARKTKELGQGALPINEIDKVEIYLSKEDEAPFEVESILVKRENPNQNDVPAVKKKLKPNPSKSLKFFSEAGCYEETLPRDERIEGAYIQSEPELAPTVFACAARSGSLSQAADILQTTKKTLRQTYRKSEIGFAELQKMDTINFEKKIRQCYLNFLEIQKASEEQPKPTPAKYWNS